MLLHNGLFVCVNVLLLLRRKPLSSSFYWQRLWPFITKPMTLCARANSVDGVCFKQPRQTSLFTQSTKVRVGGWMKSLCISCSASVSIDQNETIPRSTRNYGGRFVASQFSWRECVCVLLRSHNGEMKVVSLFDGFKQYTREISKLKS